MGLGLEEVTPDEAGLEKKFLTEECYRVAGQKLPLGHCEKDPSPPALGIVELSDWLATIWSYSETVTTLTVVTIYLALPSLSVLFCGY